MNNVSLDEVIVDFHNKWDNFPGPARLIQKDRKILAANNYAEKVGFNVNSACANVGAPESHRGCLANKTLTTKIGQGDIVKGKMARYWLPVDEFDDLFIHLSVRLVDIV